MTKGQLNSDVQRPGNSSAGHWKIPCLQWWIIVLIFLATLLNYVDRQTLSALAPTIQGDLALDDREYGNIVNIFLLAYTTSHLVSGNTAVRMKRGI